MALSESEKRQLWLEIERLKVRRFDIDSRISGKVARLKKLDAAQQTDPELLAQAQSYGDEISALRTKRAELCETIRELIAKTKNRRR